MPAQIPRRMSAEITHKWRDLAARRRAHFIELFESGRWRHYYTEEQLLARMREAVRLAETWEQLAAPPDAPKVLAAE
ncbi:MAG TPA: TIGR03809 family protein [Xanthobacteraceae bacterium]|nr:TIGR03809 family protein [Xanthobacteraceae bacterium]